MCPEPPTASRRLRQDRILPFDAEAPLRSLIARLDRIADIDRRTDELLEVRA